MRFRGTQRKTNMPKHNTRHYNTTKIRPPPKPQPYHKRTTHTSQHTPLENTAHQRTKHTVIHWTIHKSHTTTHSAPQTHQLPQLPLIFPQKRHPRTRPNVSQRNTHGTQCHHTRNPHGATTRNHGRPKTLRNTEMIHPRSHNICQHTLLAHPRINTILQNGQLNHRHLP
jgi:hypothetical protein